MKLSRHRFAALILAVGLCLAPLASAAEEEKGEKKGGAPEPSLMWEWANFAILAGVLGYMAVKQGGPFFNNRAAEIRQGISDAEKLQAESNAKIAAINAKLGRLDSEIVSLRESAASERRAAEQRIKAETEREIQHIRTRAEAEIESAGKSERVALQRYAAQLALELAETKVRARLNPETDAALVQAFVHDLGEPQTRQPQNLN